MHLDPRTRCLELLLPKVAGIRYRTKRRLGVGSLIYGLVLSGTEGVGLVLGRTWTESMTAGVTISFLPLEADEVLEQASATKTLLTLLHGVLVTYLVFDIRQRKSEQLRLKTSNSSSSA